MPKSCAVLIKYLSGIGRRDGSMGTSLWHTHPHDHLRWKWFGSYRRQLPTKCTRVSLRTGGKCPPGHHSQGRQPQLLQQSSELWAGTDTWALKLSKQFHLGGRDGEVWADYGCRNTWGKRKEGDVQLFPEPSLWACLSLVLLPCSMQTENNSQHVSRRWWWGAQVKRGYFTSGNYYYYY